MKITPIFLPNVLCMQSAEQVYLDPNDLQHLSPTELTQYTSMVASILLRVLIVLYCSPQLSTFMTLSGFIKPKLILYLVEL